MQPVRSKFYCKISYCLQALLVIPAQGSAWEESG